MDSSLSHRGGLNAFYWYQIFALASAVVEVQKIFNSHGGHLTNAMYHHGKHNQIKLTLHDEKKKRAHDPSSNQSLFSKLLFLTKHS